MNYYNSLLDSQSENTLPMMPHELDAHPDRLKIFATIRDAVKHIHPMAGLADFQGETLDDCDYDCDCEEAREALREIITTAKDAL